MRKYSSYILYLLITFLVVIIAVNGFGPVVNLQQTINDQLCSLASNDNINPNIKIVNIDTKSRNEFGDWPWNYDLLGDLVAAIGHGEPKTVMFDFLIPEDFYQDSAGYTDILASQIEWVDNVIIPYDIALTSFRDNRMNNPKYLFDYSMSVENKLGLMDEESSLLARKVFLPSSKLLESKPLLGFDYMMPDDDRIVRHHSPLVNFEGYYYPSTPLLAAASYLNVKPSQIKIFENEKIEIGSQRTIPINSNSEFYLSSERKSNFQNISAADILSESYEIDKLKNKLVIITTDDSKSMSSFNTPIEDMTSRTIINASAIDNIISNNVIDENKDQAMINLLILFLLGGLCAYFLPQIALSKRLMFLGIGLVLTAAAQYALFSFYNSFFDMIYVGLELILFMIAAPMLDSEIINQNATSEKETKKKSLPKAQTFGTAEEQLAAAPIREIKENKNSPEFEKTVAVTDSDGVDMSNADKTQMNSDLESSDFGDHQAISLDDDPVINNDSAKEASGKVEVDPTIITPDNYDSSESDDIFEMDESETEASSEIRLPENDSGPINKLGRYQITGTLGKGAMGHVYKGVDPAINRPVALKTIRLDFVSDPEEMEELKVRLHREAQAAGKLSHPNIVTIYDVGSEGQLQYIAMEYLEGRTLEDMIKKKVQFNYKILTNIIIQICNALEYAHERGIVHRDIKPANIMILPDYSVKIMDYGIARVDSNSMTKTGIAMGTPNYISPEQLQGKTVDKRADIFSLGVVIYELLLGRRPFKGENITSLIYSIINSEPMKPSDVNPQIPLLFDSIIAKSLKKNPDERYQRAVNIINDLNEFVEMFSMK